MNALIEMTNPMSRVLNAAFAPRMSSCEMDKMSFGRSPRADVLEGDKEFRVIMDLPGIKADDLEISLENQTLSVKAVRENEVPEGFERVRHERMPRAEFHRTFNLGNGIEAGGIEADFKDGVLQLVLPRSEQSLPRRIQVK